MSKKTKLPTWRTRWTSFGQDQALNYAISINKVQQNTFDVLTQKSYQILTTIGILAGLVFTGLSIVFDNNLLDEGWQQWVGGFLGVCFTISVTLTTLFAIHTLIPHKFTYQKLDNDFIDRITFEHDGDVIDQIIYSIQGDVEENEAPLKQMAKSSTRSWISLAASIVIVAMFNIIIIL